MAAATVLIALGSVVWSAPSPPTLTGLDRTSGPPHTVVMVNGTNLAGASVVWDAGLGSGKEQILPAAFLGGNMFSVPVTATAQKHPVAVQTSAGRSKTIDFTVTRRADTPPPRIDYVTLIGASFDGAGHVTTTLYVQGANLDVGAVVLIDGVEVAAAAHRALRTNWYQVPQSELGYPIDHYLSEIVIAGSRPVGSPISIVVRNLDTKVSDAVTYVLPKNAASMDSDGDQLPDAWEVGGYDADGNGTIDVDLKALGADPLRRDLFVEIDVMDDLQHPPAPEAFAAAIATFASAPIINVLGDSGIHLVLDTTGKPCLPDASHKPVCSFDTVTWTTGPHTCSPSIAAPKSRIGSVQLLVEYRDLKCANFDNARRGSIYHYAIWGIEIDDSGSGISDFADDFIVAFDSFSTKFQTVRSQAEELVHELGHDLGQRHAGDDELPEYKPNYWSVMSYSWALRTGWPKAWRKKHATCLPFYYQSAGATEVGGGVPGLVTTRVDYSEGMGKMVSRPADNHIEQVCGVPVNFDEDVIAGTSRDFANWKNLQFDGPALNERTSLTPGILP